MRSLSLMNLLSPAAKLFQRSGSSPQPSAFEALEDRRVLAAATYHSVATTATTIDVTVKYTDAQGINTSTIGNGDVRMTGPGGYNQTGTLRNFRQETTGSNNSILATYRFTSNGTAWDYSDNGSYFLRTEANQVSDTGGEMVPGAVELKRFGLWFNTPKAEVISASTTGDQLVVKIRYNDNNGIDGATIGFGEVGLRRQTDPSNVQFFRSQTFTQVSATAWDVTYRLPAVGGSWDFTDNGRYDLIINGNQVRDLASPSNAVPAQTLKTYSLWFSNPVAEYVSTSTSANDWIIRVRYRDNNGINLSSIGNGDISVTNGIRTEQATLVSGGTTQESATSVVVTYRLRPDRFAWGAGENGTYLVSVNQGGITDTTGVAINRGRIRSFNLFFDQPSISRPPAAPTITASGMEMAVTYTDNTGINLSTVGNGDLAVQGPNGYLSFATLVSKTTRVDAAGRTVVDARYRFARPVVDGSYTFLMRSNQVLDTGGRPVTSFNWATYQIDV
ncbi:MAG TPA: hypothetical protein VD997_03470 [Phycisphaerales bacterium]|nr:hypothetical protein [Phycisphaerales bacterium]